MQQESLKFESFEQEMINPLLGHELTELEEFIASYLLDATSEQPRNSRQIISAAHEQIKTQIAERHVKYTIRTLRKNHAFPILARRAKPTGYWWCKSPAEMEEFLALFKAQALDELHTLGRIVRHNYPRLAGQLRLQDAELIEADAEMEN